MGRVCCVCGSRGFSVALIECHGCEELSIHKYCLRTIPEDINEYVAWFCDDCNPEPPLSVDVPDSPLSDKDDSFSPKEVQVCSSEPITAEPSTLYVPVPPLSDKDDSFSPDEVQVCSSEPITAEPSTLYVPVPPLSDKDDSFRPNEVQVCSSEPITAEPSTLYVPVPPLSDKDDSFSPNEVQVCSSEPITAEPSTLYVPVPPLSDKDDSFSPNEVQVCSSEPIMAEPSTVIVRDSVGAKEDASVGAKEAEDGALDIDENITLIELVKKKKKRKFIRMQNENGKSAEVQGSKRVKVAEVRRSGRSENYRKNKSKKQKQTPRKGEKSCVEDDNVRNDLEAEEAKGVEGGISGGGQGLVLVDGEHCKGGWELSEVGHVDIEQSETNQKSESGLEMTLAMVCGENLRNTEDIEVDDRGIKLPNENIVYAQPIINAVWKGQFGISSVKCVTISGLSAYLSSLACEKVHNVAKLLPENLSLDLLPRLEIWPKGFQNARPTDKNIGLYFFPDNERVQKDYESLMNDMIDNQLAMKAVLENAELLIFASTLLPIEYWRFQAKFFLWGVFRKKQESDSGKDGITAGENQPIEAAPLRMKSPVSPLQS